MQPGTQCRPRKAQNVGRALIRFQCAKNPFVVDKGERYTRLKIRHHSQSAVQAELPSRHAPATFRREVRGKSRAGGGGGWGAGPAPHSPRGVWPVRPPPVGTGSEVCREVRTDPRAGLVSMPAQAWGAAWSRHCPARLWPPCLAQGHDDWGEAVWGTCPPGSCTRLPGQETPGWLSASALHACPWPRPHTAPLTLTPT